MNIFELVVLQPIFNLLIAIYSVMPWGDFGLALIIFTIIIRFALYPLVRRQLHQTKMMRKLQPELKKIRERNKGNKQAEALEMMELYKRHGVSPFRSLGILIIQLPIFIGLFMAIRVFTDNRDNLAHYTYDFLEKFEPVHTLVENPDQFNEKMLGFIDLTKHAIGGHGIDFILVAIALFSAITQYIMSKQTMPNDDSAKKFSDIMKEAAEGKQADQAEMNAIVMRNMIKIMPVMLFFIMINLPGALALYYTVSNLIAVAQQHYLLKEDVEELEELADEAIEKDRAKKRAATAKQGKVVKSSNITRITAKDTKRRPKRRKS
jgi:YidC/Oxa1 family membrane protein insertase